MKDPIRLRDQAELPSSLLDALKLLEKQAPSADMVAHVEGRLQSMSASAPARVSGRLKLMAIGTWTLALGALGIIGASQLSRHAPPPTAAPLSVPAPPAAAATVARAEPEPEPELEPAPRPEPVRTARIRSSVRRAPQPSAAETGAANPRSAAEPAARTAPPPFAATPRSASEPSPDIEPAPEPSAAAQPAEATPTTLERAEPQDEAGLLFRAKAAERSEPARALQLLELHARAFPRGKYVEEGAALTIRLHQRLGHSARAAALAKQFRQRYPDSLYSITLTP